MARRKLIWSSKASSDVLSILIYWKNRNKSISYSKKLNQQFNVRAESLIKQPHIGIKLKNNIFYIVEDNYLILYKFSNSSIFILRIWDTRRNPIDFQEILNSI